MTSQGRADLKGPRLNERSDGADAGASGKDQQLLDGLMGSLVNGEAIAHHMADVYLATCISMMFNIDIEILAKHMPTYLIILSPAYAACLMLYGLQQKRKRPEQGV